jgi:hypothetical protein
MTLVEKLRRFTAKHKFSGKGPLSVALHVTRVSAKLGLPVNADDLLAEKGTQVRGLGMGAIQAILADHGITRVLSREAGRTSRGSADNMRHYVAFLNALPPGTDLREVEVFWVDRVRDFFAAKPFKFKIDASLSLRAAVRDLLQQARERQAENPGRRYEGAMLQHLVGAKLDLVLGQGVVQHHAVSEADQAEGRAGDFTPGDVAIHVTTHASKALMARCADNLENGLRPMIITLPARAPAADAELEEAGISHRVDVLDIEQFLAANLHERALFHKQGQGPKVAELVARYNALIDAFERDPALRIELTG